MPDGPVVLNNTPLVALWTIGRLDLLRDLFGEVLIPQAVEAEFLAIDRSLRERSLADAPWVRTVACDLRVSFLYGRWFVTWLKLDDGAARTERSARVLLVFEKDQNGRFVFTEV